MRYLGKATPTRTSVGPASTVQSLVGKSNLTCFYFKKKRLLIQIHEMYSKFSDIYDEELFIKTLERDVRIVKTIPGYIMERFDYNLSNVYNFRIQAWSSINYYKDTVLPKLLEEK